MDQFQYNLAGMLLWRPSTKIVQAGMIRQKTWPLVGGGGSIFSLYIYKENFKNLLVRNRWIEFNVTWQECCFGDPPPRLFKLSWKLSKSSCQKPLNRFLYNFAEMFLWWSFTKIVQAIWIRQKTWPPGGGAYIPYISIKKTLKIFLSETTWPISLQLGRNLSLFTLYQDCSSYHDSSKNMAARGRGLFSQYIYIEKFKSLLVRNYGLISI